MKKLFTVFFLPFLLFHLLVRYCSSAKILFEQDQNYTCSCQRNPFTNKLLQFAYWIVFLPEYRSVFYRRCGLAGKLMNIYFPGQKQLYIRTNQIGGGLCINHGHSTEINALRIGENCYIFQNVTIGTTNSVIGPTIGDNCMFGTGCVVIGNIRIGNNVKIGANAVVVKDVPDNCTVVTKGTTIVKKDGEKVNIPL